MTVKGELQLVFTDYYYMELRVLTKHRENICGYCGNFNGNPDDDWVIGNSPYCMTKYPDAVRGEIVSIPYSQ